MDVGCELIESSDHDRVELDGGDTTFESASEKIGRIPIAVPTQIGDSLGLETVM